ncbi:hypothetical protein AAVH_41081, partial [Aphelenchoides avenae]
PARGVAATSKPTTRKSTTACEKPAATSPFYRAYQADLHDHFYTTNPVEHDASYMRGYKTEYVAGRILYAKAPNSVELYRLYHTEKHDHFYTTSLEERWDAVGRLGYEDEGIAGYVYQASGAKPRCPCPEVRPLYRLYKAAPIADHFYTMNATEKAKAIGSGYVDEGIAACIYAFVM